MWGFADKVTPPPWGHVTEFAQSKTQVATSALLCFKSNVISEIALASSMECVFLPLTGIFNQIYRCILLVSNCKSFLCKFWTFQLIYDGYGQIFY